MGTLFAYFLLMMDYSSTDREWKKQKNFIPPYCPNTKCLYHSREKAKERTFYTSHGTKSLKRFPYKMRRFQCRHCLHSFSYSFFKLHYREKRYGLNKFIHNLHLVGASNCEIARKCRCSEWLVRSRLSKMARWALLKHASLIQKLRIKEAIVYDGLENFSFSQYDPNNVNHAIGQEQPSLPTILTLVLSTEKVVCLRGKRLKKLS